MLSRGMGKKGLKHEDRNLKLTNFNQREFKIHTYVLDQNRSWWNKSPLAIVVPGGSFEHLSQESEPVTLAFNNEGLIV